MKILYINGFAPMEDAPMGGIFVTKRIQALKKKGIQVVPAIYGIEYSAAVQKYLEKVRHIPRPKKNLVCQLDIKYRLRMTRMGFAGMAAASFFPPLYGRKIRAVLALDCRQEKQVDLIHLHWLWPTGVGLRQFCLKRGIPYVITCHGSDVNITMENTKVRKEMLKILEDAAAVEFISEALLKKAKNLGYSGNNAAVVYNGIDGNIFGKADAGAEKERPIVAFAGNLHPVKGADRLPDIFQRIYTSNPTSVEFYVMGDGPLRTELKQKMKNLPVTFTGQITQEKLADIFYRTNVLLVPSRSEGYSCVIKEAQACGAIPVGCAVGGIPEAIGEYGADVSGPEEEISRKLADAAIEYLEKRQRIDRKEMAEKARNNTWEHMQEFSVELYRKILEK